MQKYRTSALFVAAFLTVVIGKPETQLVGNIRPLVEFWWPDPDGRVQQAALDYIKHAKVDARRYAEAIRECRSLIEETKVAGAR